VINCIEQHGVGILLIVSHYTKEDNMEHKNYDF